MKSKLFLFLNILFFGNVYGQIVINEYSCANINGPTDSFGENEDWVEFYNPTGTAFDLTGYYLSDKSSNLTKWEIPSGIVPANGYQTVFFSGNDGIFSGEIHAGFGLSQTTNEWIILASPSSAIVDSLKIIHVNQIDDSYGRVTDGSATWGVFSTPTFGVANTNALNYYSATPSVSVSGGFYASAQTVTLTSADPTATIYYTTDGTTPTAASNTYTGPINISTTTVLRARGISSNVNIPASFVETNTYFINSSHSLPVLSVCGDEVLDFLNNVAPGSFTSNFIGAFEMYEDSQQRVSRGEGYFNKHGNDSWAYDQRGFDFIMKDQLGYNNAIKHQIFQDKSRDKFKRIIVKAAANDNYSFEDGAHIRDAYVHTLSQLGNLRMDERTSRSCIVYVNGQYWGVYEVREKVDDRDFTDYYYDQDDLDFIKTWGGTWAEYGDMTHWNDLTNFINSNSMAVQSNYDYVKSQYNVGSLIDYVVLNSYTVCSDWLNWNTAWWHGHNPNGDKKKFRYALWDMDATFGHYINYTGVPNTDADADPCDPESLTGNSDPQGHITILNKLMDNPQFEQEYISRFIDLSNGIFSCVRMQEVLDSMIDVIRPEMPGQINKWGGTMPQWEANVLTLKQYIDDRCAALSAGLIGCYSLSGPFEITVDVQPVNAGKVKVNSMWLPYYSWTGTYYGNIETYFKAEENSGYEFDHWESNNHMLNYPTLKNDTLSFFTNDTIVAVFKAIEVDPGPDPEPGDPPLPPEEPVEGFTGFHLPTAFSPNDDENNDELKFYVGTDVESFRLIIFDRWGNLIFETEEADYWDGTYKGVLLNTGVYAYALTYKLDTGQEVKKTGNITLIR